MNRSSSRFQSNHQRRYFCWKTIIRSGAKKSSPPAPAATSRPWWPQPPPAQPPSTAPRTTRIGIATMIRKVVVSRLSCRSGYSTENCTGYACSGGCIACLLRTRDSVLLVYAGPDRVVLDPKPQPSDREELIMAVYTEPFLEVEEEDSDPREEILTRAEPAECTCPDFCERDHDNE